MTTIHLHKTTTATPEQVLAGLTDFGPGREEIFGRSADSYLKVHQQGPHDADVTEGSSGIWERLHYDWTDPHRVVMTTTDSNLWGGASSHTYTLTRQPTGLTDVDAVVVRDGKNLKGKLLASVLGLVGTQVLGKSFTKSIDAIEARNGGASGGSTQPRDK
ncbi:hypothetical protein EEB12_16470 [Rhodococcus sp. WS1]|uniref:hypothetical protein n=1 Tax=unclassified Rhodococcus (in: high G+C Gram-positive bacteria) TaxID=192944 RepID=UPI001144332D|nr:MULTISPECIES: hypothetical protein [unclassified Rhodococcus (in: high G+C Gram-positive bacteria)]ROZ55394.1 hypothetical protein EEB12_16470 [Rhodococcus sp. WS1]TQC39835.1 hypothetical protein EEB16_08740 [Rhodococcus sp. WS7]